MRRQGASDESYRPGIDGINCFVRGSLQYQQDFQGSRQCTSAADCQCEFELSTAVSLQVLLSFMNS